MDWIGLDEATGGGEAAAANRSRCRNGLWRRERGGLTQRRGVANRLPGGGRFLTWNCVIDAYDFQYRRKRLAPRDALHQRGARRVLRLRTFVHTLGLDAAARAR